MVTVTAAPEDKSKSSGVSKRTTELLTCPELCASQGVKIPIYCFGTQSLKGDGSFGALSPIYPEGKEEEQCLLDSLLLGQWEDRMWKGHCRYDVTTSEIKVINGRRKLLAQLSGGWSIDHLKDPEELKIYCRDDLFLFDWMKNREKLLFCIASSDKAYSELIPSASVPNGAILVFINVNPIEYGHVFLAPCGFDSPYHVLDTSSLGMIIRAAVEINNCSFRLFYDCFGPRASPLYFQACYFPDVLPVELMPVDTIFDDGGIHISRVLDYPIKTLLFESTCNFKIVVEILSKICYLLLDRSIPYNLLISDCGKKIFLFLQGKTMLTLPGLSAWECGGYFLFGSRNEFDQVTEAFLLKRLCTISLDDGDFAMVKQLCCSIAQKFVI